MRAKLIIPTGWRRIRAGSLVRPGDRIFSGDEMAWVKPFEIGQKDWDDLEVGELIPDSTACVIRRVQS